LAQRTENLIVRPFGRGDALAEHAQASRRHLEHAAAPIAGVYFPANQP